MNIVVTGSSGFIGHTIVKMLDGYDVVGIDCHEVYPGIRSDVIKQLIAERRTIIDASDRFNEMPVNLSIGFPVVNPNPDIVIHTAGFPNQRTVNLTPVRAAQCMIPALLSALELAQHSKKFVFISSSMVYGDFPNFVTEDHPLNPNTLYGIYKETGEKIVAKYCNEHDIAYTVIRPSAVYGERDVSNRLVGKFLTAAIEDEQLQIKGAAEILDFTHVDDVAQGIIQAAFSDNANNKTYNLTRSDTKCRTILEAGELAIALAGKGTLSIQDRDTAFPKRGNLSIEHARNDFGYNPTINIEEGFQRYYEWLNSVLKR
jgi:nucleoside-diphosphate-sugar epimerase